MSTNLARFESEDGIELVIDLVTGEAFATQSGYARMSGKAKSTISKRVKNELGILEKVEIETLGGLQKTVLIPVHKSINWLIKDNPKTVENKIKFIKTIIPNFEFVNFDCKKQRTIKQLRGSLKTARKGTLYYKNSENFYKNKLANELNGKTEVPTNVGRIDILTLNEIIEVKEILSWKSALGQILAYGYYYPNHKKRIHLLGLTKNEFVINIIEICKQYNVSVTFEHSGYKPKTLLSE